MIQDPNHSLKIKMSAVSPGRYSELQMEVIRAPTLGLSQVMEMASTSQQERTILGQLAAGLVLSTEFSQYRLCRNHVLDARVGETSPNEINSVPFLGKTSQVC